MEKTNILIAAVLALSLSLSAQETSTITVCNDTIVQELPFSSYFIAYYNYSQFIYPDSLLTAMNDKTITGMTFYPDIMTTPPEWNGVSYKIYLMEVDSNVVLMSNFIDTTGATKVYEGPISIVNGEMCFQFQDMYNYNGGRLLVCFETTVPSLNPTYEYVYFYGAWSPDFALCSFEMIPYYTWSTPMNFLPKCMFSYAIGNILCPSIKNLTATETNDTSAVVLWNTQGNETIWTLKYGETGFDIDSASHTQMVTDTVVLISGLNAGTQYDVYVQAFCDSAEQSLWSLPLTFRTLSCPSNEQCNFTLELQDNANNSWKECAIHIYSDSSFISSYTIDMGSSVTHNIATCPGHISLVWTGDNVSSTAECSFQVYDNSGTLIYNCSDASLIGGQPFFSFTHSCPVECDAPTDLTATQVMSVVFTGVRLEWTPSPTAETYTIYRNGSMIAENVIDNYYHDFISSNDTYTYSLVSNCSQGTVSEPSIEVSISTTISLTDNEAENAQITPNPTSGRTKVKAKGMTKVEVISMIGQRIMASDVGKYEIEIDLSGFSEGIYILRIETTTGNASKRITLLK